MFYYVRFLYWEVKSSKSFIICFHFNTSEGPGDDLDEFGKSKTLLFIANIKPLEQQFESLAALMSAALSFATIYRFQC